MGNTAKEDAISKMKEILLKHDIQMSVGACGCCSSPWITFKYKDEVILDGEEDCNFDTAVS